MLCAYLLFLSQCTPVRHLLCFGQRTKNTRVIFYSAIVQRTWLGPFYCSHYQLLHDRIVHLMIILVMMNVISMGYCELFKIVIQHAISPPTTILNCRFDADVLLRCIIFLASTIGCMFLSDTFVNRSIKYRLAGPLTKVVKINSSKADQQETFSYRALLKRSHQRLLVPQRRGTRHPHAPLTSL